MGVVLGCSSTKVVPAFFHILNAVGMNTVKVKQRILRGNLVSRLPICSFWLLRVLP